MRPGEGGTLLYLTGLNLLLGLGMALGRSSSDALFFKEFGVAYLPHLLFLTSILLVGVSMSYAAIVDRLRPGRLFNILFASFCAFLLLAWIAMRFGGGTLSFAVYYVGYGVMSEILVAHFNFYALGHFDSLQAKRLFPTVGASARLGAMLGGLTMGVAGEHAAPEDMALAWTVMLLLALVLINVRHRGEPAAAAVQRTRKRKPSEDIAEGLRFVRTSKLLRFTALGMFAVLVVINVQDYLASTLLTHHYTDSRSLAVFFGWFGAFTNATVLLLQLSTTNRLLRRFGLETVNLIFPVTSLLTMAFAALSAGFPAAVAIRFNYAGMSPAFRSPSASLFYGALPGYMQGRARAVVTGLVLPAGMAFSGLLLMLIPPEAVDERVGALGFVAAALYLWLERRRNAHYGPALVDVLGAQVFSGRRVRLDGPGLLTERVREGMMTSLEEHPSDGAALALAELLAEQTPERAGVFAMEWSARAGPAAQGPLLRLVGRLRPSGWLAHTRGHLDHADEVTRADALTLLAEAGDSSAPPVIEAWLAAASPFLRSVATRLAILHGSPSLAAAGRETLEKLLGSSDDGARCAALEALESAPEPELLPSVEACQSAASAAVRAGAVRAMGGIARRVGLDLGPRLPAELTSEAPLVRAAWLHVLPWVRDPKLRLRALLQALEDPSPALRTAAKLPAEGTLPGDLSGFEAALTDHFGHFGLSSLLCDALARSDLPQREALLEKTAERHIEAARAKHALERALRDDRLSPHGATLATLLGEEVGRHVAVVLEILVLLDEGEASRAIRAGLSARDRRLRAHAVESMRHLEHAAILKHLMPLLEGEPDTALARATKDFAARPWGEKLAWCKGNESAWLSRCAAALDSSAAPERPSAMRSVLETLFLLQRVPYFALLRTDQLQYVVPLLEPTGWTQGERVFDLGDPGEDMYIIVKGRIGISLDKGSERPELVVELGAGDCFGEMGILDDQPRSATAHVLEDTEALALGREKLNGLLLAYPELGIGILRALGRRLRVVSADLAKARGDGR